MAKSNQQTETPPELALWIADVVQVETLSKLTSKEITDEHLQLIQASAGRLWGVLQGVLTPEQQSRMRLVAERMTMG